MFQTGIIKACMEEETEDLRTRVENIEARLANGNIINSAPILNKAPVKQVNTTVKEAPKSVSTPKKENKVEVNSRK